TLPHSSEVPAEGGVGPCDASLPACRGGRRRSRRMVGVSPPRSPGRSAAKPPGGGLGIPIALKELDLPTHRELASPPRPPGSWLHLPARRGGRRQSRRVGAWAYRLP